MPLPGLSVAKMATLPTGRRVNGFGPDQFGRPRAGFSAARQISRHDLGISLTILMDGGGAAVGDKVSISLQIEAFPQK